MVRAIFSDPCYIYAYKSNTFNYFAVISFVNIEFFIIKYRHTRIRVKDCTLHSCRATGSKMMSKSFHMVNINCLQSNFLDIQYLLRIF